MHITRTNPSPTKTKLVIKAEQKELSAAKELALKHLSSQVKVPGFRAGHVPPAVVEKRVDPNALQSEVIEHTINKLYASAVRKEDIRPVANPQIAIKKFVPFTELEFEAEIDSVGEIKLADYKKMKLAKKPVKIEQKEIDDVLKSLQARAATRNPVKRAAKLGDEAVIDFKGTDKDGKPVAGADGTDYPLILGSNSFIPGFEDEVVGVKSGESKTFTVTFPKDYGAKALQNKKVTFEVTIKTLNEMSEPKLDDEFAAAVGPFKSLKELKADIEKQLTFERERETQNQYDNELLEKLADKSKIEIPAMLIDEQIDRIEQEEKQNLMYRGQTWEEHLKEEGVTAEEHREQKRPAAEQRVKIGILLSEVAEAEGVEVTPEEVEIRLQLMKGQYQDPAAQAELAKPEVIRDIETRIRTEKTLEKLRNYAGAV